MIQLDHNRHMQTISNVDIAKASETLDRLIDLIADMLPVDDRIYPELANRTSSEAVTFCLRHSALHFSKTAGRLAAFVENVDHGKYDQIQTLQTIVAASLVNSLKLADEIGISGPELIQVIQEKFALHDQEGQQR